MNIFLHELKMYRKTTFIWTLSMIALVTLFLSLFPALTKDIADTKQLFEGFPDAIVNGMGIVFDNFDNILGYYAFPISFVLLLGAIQGMNMGITVISKEIRDKTADFLLTKPVTRVKILTCKILALIASLVITNIIYMVAAGIVANIVSEEAFNMQLFVMISITLIFVQLIFMSLGILMSVIIRKIKSVLGISLGTVFAFYFISFLSTTASDDVLRYFTPFKYFDPSYIIENKAYEIKYSIISLVFIVLTVTASYIIYKKRDIHAI